VGARDRAERPDQHAERGDGGEGVDQELDRNVSGEVGRHHTGTHDGGHQRAGAQGFGAQAPDQIGRHRLRASCIDWDLWRSVTASIGGCQYGTPSMQEGRMTKTNLLLEQPAQVSRCDGALASPLARERADELALLLKAVADPVRLQLLSRIRAAESQEACVCDLTDAVNLSQPTVSHHLKVLTEAGLLTRERRGSWAWFTVVPTRLTEVASIFS